MLDINPVPKALSPLEAVFDGDFALPGLAYIYEKLISKGTVAHV